MPNQSRVLLDEEASQVQDPLVRYLLQSLIASSVLKPDLNSIGILYGNVPGEMSDVFEQAYTEPEAGEMPNPGFQTFIADQPLFRIYYDAGA